MAQFTNDQDDLVTDVDPIWQDASTAQSAWATALWKIPGRYARDVSMWKDPRDADPDTFAWFF